MDVVLIGPPASGKGMQARILEQRRGLKPVSTGDLLRAEITADTDLGRIVAPIMKDGGFISDDIVNTLIGAKLDDPDYAGGIVFDGYPRTLAQAKSLTAMFAERARSVTAAIHLDVSEEELFHRLEKRKESALKRGDALRPDDTEETLQKRIDLYKTQTLPVLPYYKEQGLFHTIDGMRGIEATAADIKKILKAAGRVTLPTTPQTISPTVEFVP